MAGILLSGICRNKSKEKYKILSVCRGGGYRYCRTDPPHPRANSKGLYPLHRVLAENALGRSLGRFEHVHHVDENKENNDSDNLMVLTAADHRRAHAKNLVSVRCDMCGAAFSLKPYVERLRRSRNASGSIYCSRSCGRV